jgi:hypothetical protein
LSHPFSISVPDILTVDSSITSPQPIALGQVPHSEGSAPILSATIGQSDEEILARMMSSERGDCSEFVDLFF